MAQTLTTKPRRLFFALLPDEQSKQAIHTLSHALPLSSRQRIVAENWHITLVFIGFIESNLVSSIIAATALHQIPAMTLVFDQLEYWRKSGIVCLTCSQIEPMLNQLVSQLSTPLLDFNIKLESRPYYPHLTLARRVNIKPTVTFQPISWFAQHVVLMESISNPTGVTYQPLKCWQLTQQHPKANN